MRGTSATARMTSTATMIASATMLPVLTANMASLPCCCTEVLPQVREPLHPPCLDRGTPVVGAHDAQAGRGQQQDAGLARGQPEPPRAEDAPSVAVAEDEHAVAALEQPLGDQRVHTRADVLDA